jgi:tRNA pseudouridine55 synthase
VNGVLIIDKPADFTSHDVVARARRLGGERRAGHTGTLDPFATGVLVLLVGRSTRLAQFLSGAEKEYEAVIRLGYATSTGDATGNPINPESPGDQTTRLSDEEIEAALETLRGEIEQVPPMYSAKKIAGRKLYELARRGEEIERQPVRVMVSQFVRLSELRGNEDGTADLRVRVVCSAGTYIRTLAEDLGRRVGRGAHLAELRRTRAGKFTIDQAITLDQLAEFAAARTIESVLISPDEALSHLPVLDLSALEAHQVANGIDIPLPDSLLPAEHVRLREASGNLLAVGVYDQAKGVIHPQVVIG